MKKSSAYHLSLSVSNGSQSRQFYDALFQELAWERVYEDDEAAGYSDGEFTLWIIPAEQSVPEQHTFKAVGFHHFSVRVQEKKQVDQIYKWCAEHNITVVDTPAAYPEYNENYYAVFFLDPDGMKIEVTYV